MQPTITVEQWRLAQSLEAELAALDDHVETAIPALREESRNAVGAVLGAAIGDALGHPTEFIRSVERIRERYGPGGVRGFSLYWERGGRRFAPYTDDTQLAEAVLRTLVWSRATRVPLDETMVTLGKRFVVWAYLPQGGHRAPGNATLAGCRRLAQGVPWRSAGAADAGGCGSVMRAYPFGVVFRDDVEKAENWAVEHSRLTHAAPPALAACAAMAVGTVGALRGGSYSEVFEDMSRAARRWDAATATMMDEARSDAERGVGPEVTLERLQGWAAHEAIAAALYLVARHSGRFEDAVLEGANTPGDSDSIASLTGALIGSRVGESGIPLEWRDELERSAELRALAERAWAVGRSGPESP